MLSLHDDSGSISISGNQITNAQQVASQALTVGRVTFLHLVGQLITTIDGPCYRKLLMVGSLSLDDRGICGQKEVDLRVACQVFLKFYQINIQDPIKSEESGDGRHNLTKM